MALRIEKSEPDPSWFGNGPNPHSNPKWTNKNWLKSRFHFSFAEYHDSRRQAFGVLRVMNDDLVQPARGFGTHPHRDMEIVTYVVEGDLTHRDSMGTQETLERGSIQFMTAGTGVRHSEFNVNNDKPLRFIQMWITPRRNLLEPNYGSLVGKLEQRHNKWAHLVADVANKDGAEVPIHINQDANIFVAELDAGVEVELPLKPARQAYFLCMEGDVQVQSEQLKRHDAARIYGSGSDAATLTTKAGPAGAHVLVVEMKSA